ncbi:Leucine-rich repeat-containing protein 9 [Phytophthora boehmeriae]|uniref:Leucine-rich repeat-containing protein 9 n=1 Tax=Phytophthora boehmeriae TaxID=109152 RepID=A0A8T1WKN0_9STRA|nr:Leucine-rich repeat-containing protein 9 [Phytophthora boehmeriae]
MQDGRRGSSAGSSHGSDASSLPLISTPPQRNPSAKGHRPLKQTAIQTPSDCDADSDANSPLEASVGTPSSSEDALSAIQQEKTQLFASSPDLELLCRENGLSAAQFARFSDTVTTLDMFLGFWGSMKSAMYFPALKELSIINQPTICELEGLATCFNLEKLCITECNLTKIGGLSNCTRLKQLNLCSNRIKKLENLESLVNLEQLWVNQNQLERLDGLWRLTKLTQLWACRNRIDRLDTALNNCGSLTEVNLADNRLTNFKGLLSLTNLDQLTVLTLSDPHFGDNPVCRLCNYQTYLMCQLPRLAFLDTVELSARNKQIAEATMIKKKMYYNMRIKSIKRDVHARTRHAETIRNQVEHQVEINVAALVRQKKEIEQFIVESRSLKEALSSQNMLNDLEKKLDCINTCLRERYAAVYRMNQDFERLRCSLRSTSEMNIARLLVELETEMRKFGIDDIQINRVTRINNRYLRNRFTARMEEVLEAPDRKVKDNVSKKARSTPSGTIRPTKSPRILHCNEEDTINLGAAAKQVDDFERKYRIQWSSVEEIILNHELLGSIENLDRAVNLRIASFSDNVIKRIDGLQACTRLEELSLDDNEITQIKNLESLTFLKKLHLGRNRLTTIQHLESLENLIQLSLEENQISSLRGLGSAMKLMELYLGNNQIENLKEVQHLKSLPKLTILDLSGNELTRLPDYRLYTVYYLRRVKVLDGVSVSTQDQGNAKQKYSGKLTLEFILDKCGGGGGVGENPFGRLVDMDLSSCRIREISPITGANFPNVREINLENNQISDISSLEGLSSLRVLNLNRNRIDKLAPSNSQSIDYTLPENCDGGGKGILACLNLEQLYLAYNQITDMSVLGLQFLDNLKVLHLQGNAIVYFAGLECNTELVDIRLDKNRIRQLDPHSTLALRQLKFLNLEDNGLKSLSNFNNMLRLETLELSNNRLTELEEVDKLCALPSMLDLRMNNNPLTKRHLYRQHVLFKLTSLRVLDSKDVYSDERERIDLLFLHERAVAGAPGLDRNLDNRAGIGIPHNEVLAGSLLRKTPTTPGMSTPSFPLPEHQVDPSIAIGASNTTTRSLLAPSVNSSRNLTSLGNQSSWQAGSPGAANGSSNFPPSSTVTVASTFNAKSLGSSGTDHLKFVGSSLRRRMLSVHYDQQNAPFQVNSMLNDAKLPVGVVSSPVVVRSPAATIRRGFNMQPSSIDSQIPLVGASADRTSLNSVNDAANSARGSFSGYVVTFGNQKRHVSLSYPGQQPEPSLPYHSTKMPQQAKRQR